MNIDIEVEENILNKYCKTLSRKNILNMQINKFIKKPYLENYIIQLSSNVDKESLEREIVKMYEYNKITVEELLLFVNSNIEKIVNGKNHLENFFFKNEENHFITDIILFQIEYFKFYNIVTELLFDNKEEDNELYYFILIFIKNKPNEIKIYIRNNVKFKIFYWNLFKLESYYSNIIRSLVHYHLYPSVNEKEILNLFIKNLFTNWYKIYKNDLLENKVNEKIKNYVVKRNILSQILCLPNI